MKSFKEMLKNAICNYDISFLEKNKHRFSIDERFEDENNDTLLLYSLSDAEVDSFKYFAERNADITLSNDEGENIIHSIIFSGKVERMNIFLNEDNINHQTKEGVTPLLLSILLEKYDIAHYLLEKGADVNLPDNKMNMPIHVACSLGNMELVSELIERNANLFVKTENGNFPLSLALNNEHHELVKMLYGKMYNEYKV